MIRKYTNYLLDAIDQGTIDPKEVAMMALQYMSEDQVEDMCISNDLDLSEPDEDYDGQPDEAQEWHDFGERYSDEYDSAW